MAKSGLDSELSKLSIDRTQRKRSGGWLGRLITLLLLAIVFGGGYVAYSSIWTAPVVVSVIQPTEESSVSTAGQAVLTAGGYIVARDVYVISTKIDGRVEEIFIERGQVVAEGDTIITIEDEEHRAQVKLASAQVAQARARLEQMLAGSRPAEIARARADVASARAIALQKKRDEERFVGSGRDGIASSSEVDVAKADRLVAEANLNSLEEMLRLVELGPRTEEIAVARASLLQSDANLEYMETQLDFTVIRAPITGTILEKVAKKGEMVTTNNFGGQGARSAAVSMADLTDLQVELDINEDDLPRVRLGQRCELGVDSHPDAVIVGEVDEIAPRADRQKATVQVKVKILNPPPFLRPEVNARVTFLEEKTEEVVDAPSGSTLWVPREVVRLGSGGSIVYLVHAGKVLVREVETGREGALGLEIVEGLVGDEQIISSNLDLMEAEMRVAVQ
jgi:HlyD family secretion protein